MSNEEEKLKELRGTAQEKLREAERAWYAYACECDVGDERIQAFEVYENVRTAGRIR